MATFIIKATPDEDLYTEWCTSVDAPTCIGTRAQITILLQRNSSGCDESSETRIERANNTGTRARPNPQYSYGPADGAWDDSGLIVAQRGWPPRSRFGELLKTYADNVDAAHALLDPFDDEADAEGTLA